MSEKQAGDADAGAFDSDAPHTEEETGALPETPAVEAAEEAASTESEPLESAGDDAADPVSEPAEALTFPETTEDIEPPEAGLAAAATDDGPAPEDGESADDGEADDDGEEPDEEDGEGEETDGDGPEEGDEADSEAPALPFLSIVEALLFAARGPLKPSQIARAVGKGTRQEAVRKAIEELNVHYLETSRAFEIAEISGCYQLMSRPEYVAHILRIYPKKELAERDKSMRLTPAALDTLAIIAYKQPVTRGEIEHIRGVGCGPVLRALIERGTVKVAGKRADLVGQPLMYGTTDAFLTEFGLGSLDELPHRSEFMGMMEPQ